MKEKVVANENLMRKQRTELHLALYFCWRVKRSLARRQTWRPLAVNNKADKDSRVPSRRTSAEIPQSFCHYSRCSLLMCSICILSRCGLCTLFRLLAGKIMQNSNAGHTVQMLIFLSIQQPILCINLHYNGRGNKKKGENYHHTYSGNGFWDDWSFFHVNKQQNGTIMMLWAAISIQGRWWACVLVKWGPTGILPSFISVDKAGDQHNECEESNGAHQPDKPALGRYSSVNAGQTWGEQYWVTLTRLGLFIRTLDWMFTSTEPIWCKGSRQQGTPLMETLQY